MCIRDRLSNERAFSLLERHFMAPILCLRDLELVSSSTSRYKEDYAPKWKERAACILANCPRFKAEISLVANPEHRPVPRGGSRGSIEPP